MSSPQAPGIHSTPASKMAIIELPPEREDVTQAMMEEIRLELPGLSSLSFADSRSTGFDSIITKIYSVHTDAILISRTSKTAPINEIIVFVKPYKINPLISVERGFLEGLGYNVDNHKMAGTIFSGMPNASLTDDDIAIINEIYSQ